MEQYFLRELVASSLVVVANSKAAIVPAEPYLALEAEDCQLFRSFIGNSCILVELILAVEEDFDCIDVLDHLLIEGFAHGRGEIGLQLFHSSR